MKKAFIIFPFLLAFAVSGQQSAVFGRVAVFNSGFETGSVKYLSTVKIGDLYKKTQETLSASDGRFKLVLVGYRDLEKVSLDVQKAKYAVVNTEALEAVAGQKEPVNIYMAVEGKIAENKLKYYRINKIAAEKALNGSLAKIGEEIANLQQNAAANKAQIEKLQKEYGRLYEKLATVDEIAGSLAELYSTTNLDECSKEYQLAFRYYRRGLLDSALLVFQKNDLKGQAGRLVAAMDANQGLNDRYVLQRDEHIRQKAQTLEALQFKANLHQTKFEFDRVEECYGLLLKLDSLNQSTLWQYADYLYKQRQDLKSIYFYEKALRVSKNNEYQSAIYSNLGVLYQTTHKMRESETAFESALGIERRLANRNPGRNRSTLAETLNNVAIFYRNNNKAKQAEAAFLEALDIYRGLAEKKQGDPSRYIALLQNNLGAFYSDQYKMAQAESAYLEALNINRRMAEKDPDLYLPDLAQVLNNLGEFYRVKKDLTSAESYFGESLRIRRQLAGKNPDAYLPDVAKNLNNLGNVYTDRRKIPEAEAAFAESLTLMRRLAVKNPATFKPDLALSLMNVGVFYGEAGNAVKEEAADMEALQIYRALATDYPEVFLPQVAKMLNNLGEYYNRNQKTAQAKTVLKESVQLFNTLAERNRDVYLPYLANTCNNLGMSYGIEEKALEAQYFFEQSLPLFRELASKNPAVFELEVARTLLFLGTAYRATAPPKSRPCFVEALQLAEKYPDVPLARQFAQTLRSNLRN